MLSHFKSAQLVHVCLPWKWIFFSVALDEVSSPFFLFYKVFPDPNLGSEARGCDAAEIVKPLEMNMSFLI